VQTWALSEIEAPEGTRDPVVLETADGARAVLLVLAPGQELREHEVKERAWVTVLEGAARIAAADGESVEAAPGTLATFEPGERHSVSSESGARVLLLLAPWPAEDHFGPAGGRVSADAS
jgi:quercetin dioxygenase-like cupin family protein